MSNTSRLSARPAIRTVPDLIGREDLLKSIVHTIQTAGTAAQTLLLTGEGGIGKTRLLYAVAEACRADETYRVATQEIDCYDPDTHSKQQFAAQLASVMPDSVSLTAYHQAVRDLQRAEQRNDPQMSTYRRAVELALRADLNQASQEKRLIIMLDTIERFVYIPPSQEHIAQIANSWNWISDELLSIPNMSWVFAGRSAAEYLFRNIQASTIIVPDFTEQGAREYIEALIIRAKKENNEVIASRLQTLLAMELFPIIYQQSAGRPLTLALLADLMTVTNLPSTNVQATHQAIINRLMEVEDLGVMLRVFGRLRRGADVDMLRTVLNTADGWPVERTSRVFDEFKNLSFVKKPRGERYFLHDIMYEWLDQYLYKDPREQRHANKIYGASIEYCKNKETQVAQELDTIFSYLEQGRGRFDIEAYTFTRNHRRQALLDRLYYELCNNPLDGWRFYLRYTFDAILGGDPILDVLLLSQILNALTELENREQLQHSGLSFELVRSVALIRPVARAFAENDFIRANIEAEKIEQIEDIKVSQSLKSSPMIDIWHAAALVQLAGADNLERAELLIRNAIAQIEVGLSDQVVSRNEEAEDIRELIGLTFAYQILGDYYRQRDQAQEAREAYREAVKRGRESKVLIILLLSLTRLGLVLNRLGKLDDAVALIEDALDMRLQIGLPNLIAAAYSSLGIVLTSQGNYSFAIDNLEKTVAIYRAIGHILGMAQNQANLAEAKRRYAGTVGLRGTQEGVRLLHEAIGLSEEAGVSAEQSVSPRTAVRSYIELGCALRALARETYEGKVRTAFSLPRLINESEDALRKASKLAEEKALPVLHLDALVNIPFLYYYVGDIPTALNRLDEISREIPQSYLIQPLSVQIKSVSEPQIALWRPIAKLTTLRGHIAYDRFQELGQDEALRDCAQSYMLAMEYNERYSQDEIGGQRSRQQIYDRLRKLDVHVLRQFALYVQEWALLYGIEEIVLKHRLDNRTLWFA